MQGRVVVTGTSANAFRDELLSASALALRTVALRSLYGLPLDVDEARVVRYLYSPGGTSWPWSRSYRGLVPP